MNFATNHETPMSDLEAYYLARIVALGQRVAELEAELFDTLKKHVEALKRIEER